MSPAEAHWAELIEKSGLLSQVLVQAYLEQLRSGLPRGTPVTEQFLAESFVQAGLLTRWQAEKLVAGRFKGFFVGNYKILGHLGAGTSSVYLAEHRFMHERRALKMAPPHRTTDPTYIDRLCHAARAAAQLVHPNVVRLYELGCEGHLYYLVYEYFEAPALKSRLAAQGPLPCPLAAEVIRQAARGLGHLHQMGMVHGDIRPSNVLVDDRGNTKIMNLSSTRRADSDAAVGAVDFLAPECAIHGGKIDGRADLYSLGCMLYVALTGRPPFDGSTAEKLVKHQKHEPPPLREVRADVSKGMVVACRRLMAKNPDERFQTAAEVDQALTDLTGQ
jgi:serine/threonine-protein kinase